jgi:hypothetical protein
MIAEMFLYGFVSAFGWWSANHYVIEPVLEGKPASMERPAKEVKKEEVKKEDKREDKKDKE